MAAVERSIPQHVAGMVGEEGGRHLHDDLATCGSGMPPGGKRQLIREGGQPPRLHLTTAGTKTSVWTVLLADTHDSGGISDDVRQRSPIVFP